MNQSTLFLLTFKTFLKLCRSVEVLHSSFHPHQRRPVLPPASLVTLSCAHCSQEHSLFLWSPQQDIYACVSPRVIALDAPLSWLTSSLHSGLWSGATFVRDFLSLVPVHCHSSSQGLALFFSWQHWWSKWSHRFIHLHVYYLCLPVECMSMIAGGSLLSSLLSFHLLKWEQWLAIQSTWSSFDINKTCTDISCLVRGQFLILLL